MKSFEVWIPLSSFRRDTRSVEPDDGILRHATISWDSGGVLPWGSLFETRIVSRRVGQRRFWLHPIVCHNARCSSLAMLKVQYRITSKT